MPGLGKGALAGGQLLTVAQVADYLQVPVQTLYLWHHKGTGPKAIKVGRHLRYRESDLDAWVESLVNRNGPGHSDRAEPGGQEV